MANATPRDSRAGFTIYRESGGSISRDALNDELISAGYGPVSDRTMAHYRSLLEAGFDRYISINRFDVARSASRFEDLGASPRYGFQTYGEGVRLMIARVINCGRPPPSLNPLVRPGSSSDLSTRSTHPGSKR